MKRYARLTAVGLFASITLLSVVGCAPNPGNPPTGGGLYEAYLPGGENYVPGQPIGATEVTIDTARYPAGSLVDSVASATGNAGQIPNGTPVFVCFSIVIEDGTQVGPEACDSTQTNDLVETGYFFMHDMRVPGGPLIAGEHAYRIRARVTEPFGVTATASARWSRVKNNNSLEV
jgi:hypothetical protein